MSPKSSILVSIILYGSALTVIVPLSTTATGTMIYVNDDNTSGIEDGSLEYPYNTIQEGVNAASNGDTVYVFCGTYNEHVTIDKSITLQGESRDDTVIDSGGIWDVVTVSADLVNVSGFTIQNGDDSYDGIVMVGVEYCHISDVRAAYNIMGIYIEDSHFNVIENCEVSNNTWTGIRTLYSDRNVFKNNTCVSNDDKGMLLSYSNYNLIENNMFTYNYKDVGLALAYSSSNIIKDNNASYNGVSGPGDGITLTWYSNNNVIQNNTCLNNYWGIHMGVYCDGNLIISNNFSDNRGYGVSIQPRNSYNKITQNIFSNNYGGISISTSNVYTTINENYFIGDRENYVIILGTNCSNTTISHNNFIKDCNIKVWDKGINNSWHNTTLLEGNYWSNYTGLDDGSGSGKHAIAGDGIGDTEIPHPTTGFDFYPFMNENGWQVDPNQPPVSLPKPNHQLVDEGNEAWFFGNFSYDPDGQIVFFDWDFGDGAKGIGITTPHVYTSPGYYTVTLTVTDNDGATHQDSCTIQVQEPIPPPPPPPPPPPSAGDDWPMFNHDPQHSGFSTSDAPDSPNLQWVFTGPTRLTSPSVANGTAVVVSWEPTVYALHVNTGDILWSYDIQGIPSQPVIANEMVFVSVKFFGGGGDYIVYCFDIHSGDKLWDWHANSIEWLEDQFTSYDASPVTAANNGVYFILNSYGGDTNFVFSLDDGSGDLIWNANITDSRNYYINASLAVTDDRIFYSTNHYLWCLNEVNGDILWNFHLDQLIFYSAPSVSEDKVFIGNDYSPDFYCLNVTTGDVIWQQTFNQDYTYMTPSISDDKVIVAANEAMGFGDPIYALDVNSGNVLWRDDYLALVISTPAVADNKVFCTHSNGTIRALDLNNGNFLWKFTASDTYMGWHESNAIAYGKLFVSLRNKLYVLGPGDPVNQCMNQCPVANAGPDQTVYVGDNVLFDGSESYDPDTYWEIIPENPFGFTSSTSITSEDTHFGDLYSSNPKLSQKGDHIASYEWDFCDDSPPGIGARLIHIYKSPGVYSVVLTVTDSNGAKATDICKITVLPIINPPIADAGPDQTSYEGDIVQFDGSRSMGSTGGGWNIQTVDSIGWVGWYSSITLDKKGNPHISYFDDTMECLKYAKWNGTDWNIQIVDDEGRVGGDPSIKLDNTDYPHISYADANNGDLKYVKWTGSAWNIETVDSIDSVGFDTSLALDSNYYPHISYYDSTNGDVKYARWTGSTWSIEIVDYEGWVGWDTSIAIDNHDLPHITYSHNTNYDLRYAKWTGSEWNIQTVDNTGNIGSCMSSMTLDTKDYAHISYYDCIDYDLKYAKWNGSNWSIETVDSAGWAGWDPSITLDSSEYVHICYVDLLDYSLKYARWTGSSWNIETVDSENSSACWTSISLDNNNFPHISYFDGIYGDLKYAKWTPEELYQIVSYHWDFAANLDTDGDGIPTNDIDATGPTPTHIYGDNGVYTVILTVTNNKGLSDTDTLLVKVNNVAPSIMNIETYVFANFTLRVAGEKWHNVELFLYEEEVESGYAGVVRYPGSPDNQSATIGNLKCNVTKSITVKVIYTPDDDPINGQINGANPCWINISFEDGSYELLFHIFNVNHPETWIWNIDINQYLLRHEITYVGTAKDLGSDDLKFIWNWGDGSPDTVTTYYNNGLNKDPYPSPWGSYPFTAIDVKKHIFTTVGRYSTKLTVIDDDNGIDSDYTTVAFNNIAPTANAGGIYAGNEGSAIIFTGNHMDPDASDTFKYYWDFGDGSSSTRQNPSHIYMNHGTYTVTLIITDNCGGTGIDTCVANVNAHPISNVGPDQNLFEGERVQFDGSQSYDPDGRIIEYKWDFDANIDANNDGDYTNDADAFGSSAQHTYFFEGEYQVTLTVTDGLSIRKDALIVTVLAKMKTPVDVGDDQQENLEESKEDINTGQETTTEGQKRMNQDIEKNLEPAMLEEVISESIPADTETNIKDHHNDGTSVNPEIQPSEDKKKDNKPDFPVVTITVSIGSIILSTLSLSMPLYMKINRKDLLKNRKRKSIYKYISANSGDNFNGIKQALNLPNGVLTYHLKILERENFITSKRDGGYKRFYLSGKSKMNNIKKLNGIQNIIFKAVKDFPGISQTEIANKVGATVQVVNYHIKRLQEDGLIKIRMTNGHRSQCFLQNREDLSIT
jgi:parallel beta-helix repeat protein